MKRSSGFRDEETNKARECPVCMESFTEFASGDGGPQRVQPSPVCFPCGHTVCSRCDDQLKARGFHRCPLCRTVREGMSEESADLARQFSALQDQSDGSLQFLGAGTLQRNNNNYQLVFLSNQAEGSPFGPINDAIQNVLQRSASSASRSTPSQRRNERRSFPRYDEEGETDADEGRPEEEINEDEENTQSSAVQERRVIDESVLPIGLRNLLHSLRSNHSLERFMELRRASLATR